MNPINFMGMNQCKHGAICGQQQCHMCELETDILSMKKTVASLEAFMNRFSGLMMLGKMPPFDREAENE